MGLESQDCVASELFDYFHNRDILQRREAAEAIAKIDPAPIIRALNSSDAAKRKAALEMVGGIELKSAIKKVAELIEDPDDEVRVMACGTLGEIQGYIAKKILIKKTKSPDTQVKFAAVAALGRAYTPGFYTIIRDALCSNENALVEAGQKAVEFSQEPDLLKRLLKDQSLTGDARNALWKAISNSPMAHGNNVLEVSTDLSDEHQESAVIFFKNFFYVTDYKILKKLKKQKGVIGRWADEHLEYDKRRLELLSNAWKEVSKTLICKFPVKETADLLADADFETLIATCEHLAQLTDKDHTIADLILELLKDKRSRVRAGALTGINKMNKPPKQLEDFLLKMLEDNDPTVRYYSCLAAAKHNQIGAVEAIGRLIDDSTSADWYRIGVGRAVKNAARYALDILNPASKVWRKPFQESFREKKD
jgi:hypothetical protein